VEATSVGRSIAAQEIGVQLSVIVPVFNESARLIEQIDRLDTIRRRKEILIIDDGSSDGTREKVERLDSRPDVRVFFHICNRGKGAAIRTGLEEARGDVVIIQDADLEYDPSQIELVVAPILDGRAVSVYGSRFANRALANGAPTHRLANRFLTSLSTRLTGLALTDMETCYKALRRDIGAGLDLKENRFGIEPEITAKLARGGWRIMEVPIAYTPRSRKDGKKIGAVDGLRAIYCNLRYAWAD
jgi:glycosyltransferase involved in cell wall biosynthesis